MCEKCEKYLLKDYKICPKCESLLTNKFDHDKRQIQELEQASTIKLSSQQMKEMNSLTINIFQFIKSKEISSADVFSKYRRLFILLKDTITKRINSFDSSINIYTLFDDIIWRFNDKNDVISCAENKIKSLGSTNIITLNIMFTEKKLYKCFIFTEAEIEEVFTFFQGKTWLTPDVKLQYKVDKYSLSKCSNMSTISSTDNFTSVEQKDSSTSLDNVYSLRRILIKYKNFIINDIIEKELNQTTKKPETTPTPSEPVSADKNEKTKK